MLEPDPERHEAVLRHDERRAILLTSAGLGRPGGGGRQHPLAGRQGPGRVDRRVRRPLREDRRRSTARTSPSSTSSGARPPTRRGLREALRGRPTLKAVLLTHNETSTGVMNPIRELAAAVRERAGRADPRRRRVRPGRRAVRAWTPGASTSSSPARRRAGWPRRAWRWSSVSPRAWARDGDRDDAALLLRPAAHREEHGQRRDAVHAGHRASCSRSTRACGLMNGGGRPAIFARHAACAAATRAGLDALGFQLFADPAHASETVTARLAAGRARLEGVQQRAQARAGSSWPVGRAKLTGKIFRIGHLGSVTLDEILAAIGVIESACSAMGRPVAPGTAVAAAQRAGLEAIGAATGAVEPAREGPRRRAARRRGHRPPARPSRGRRAARAVARRALRDRAATTTRSSSAARSRSTPR